jgi:hypothetical protein
VADAVAIVSVVSGATVAIVVPFVNSMLERQRLRWQGNQARLDELRSIVDSSLAEMVRVHDLLWDLAELADSPESGPTAKERRAALAEELTRAYGAVKTLGTRIGLRLGNEDAVAVAHDNVEVIVAQAEIAAARPLQRGEVPDAAELWAARNELGLAIGRFQEQVRELIGPIRERRAAV